MLPPAIQSYLQSLGISSISKVAQIQELWSGYGQLLRVFHDGGSVVVKHVIFPNQVDHPRGWHSNIGHERKVKSYQVEANFYAHYSEQTNTNCRVPKLLGKQTLQGGELFVLEDLDAVGFSTRTHSPNAAQVSSCLKWLANFHAEFMFVSGEDLWEQGTYWHLATRPKELEVLDDLPLKNSAKRIDEILERSPYQTLVHGDAKVANFCFGDNSVAAVDFQYVGKGIGMKDLAYFIGSVFHEEELPLLVPKLLDEYFEYFQEAFQEHPEIGIDVEYNWRMLFPYAWADFHRFLKGWSPGHWKINSYSEQISAQVVQEVQKELDSTDLKTLEMFAVEAAKVAGEYIRTFDRSQIEVDRKSGGYSEAASVVTQVDRAVENIILEDLKGCVLQYDLGVLAEENEAGDSRFFKPYFFCIDPLDGTLSFIENKPGYSVVIALVSKWGEPLLGVVHDVARNITYNASKGNGVFKNGEPFLPAKNTQEFWFLTDRSFQKDPRKEAFLNDFEQFALQQNLIFKPAHAGGATMNALTVLEKGGGVYFKPIKNTPGGGSLWDFAASAAIYAEVEGAQVGDCFGRKLGLNRRASVFMNVYGVLYSFCLDTKRIKKSRRAIF